MHGCYAMYIVLCGHIVMQNSMPIFVFRFGLIKGKVDVKVGDIVEAIRLFKKCIFLV